MRPHQELERNLRRLTGRMGESVSTAPGRLARRVSRDLPLSHSTGRARFRSVVEGGRLLSLEKLVELGWRQLPESGEPPTEVVLGTADSVFTFAAPFRYPATACGFLFKTDVERDRADQAVATPFDSGGTVHYLRPSDPRGAQVAFVRDHELPVPGYRSVLALFLEHLFDSPWDYVDGTGPRLQGPIAVEGGDWRRWTFEVRFTDELRLAGSLSAILVPVAVASQAAVRERLAVWRRAGVVIRIFRSAPGAWQQLQRLSVKVLSEYLGRNRG